MHPKEGSCKGVYQNKEGINDPCWYTMSQFSSCLWIPFSVSSLHRGQEDANAQRHSTNSSQLRRWWHFLLSSHRFLWTLLNSRWRMRKFLCIPVQLEPAEKQRCPLLCISRQLHRRFLQSLALRVCTVERCAIPEQYKGKTKVLTLSITLIFLHLSKHCAHNSNSPSNSQLLLLYQEHYMLEVSKERQVLAIRQNLPLI